MATKQIKKRFLLFFIFCFFCSSNAFSQPVIENLRFSETPNDVRIVLDLARTVHFSILQEEATLIKLHLKKAKLHGTVSSYSFPVRAIKALRFIQDSSSSGLILEISLAKKGKIKSVFNLSGRLHRSSGARLVVDIQKIALMERVRGGGEQGRRNVTEGKSLAPRYPSLSASGFESPPAPSPYRLPSFKPPVHHLKKKYTIVIDPGHGGEDPGAISQDGLMEKEITFRFAQVLKRKIEKDRHFKVRLTRENDIFIPLRQRVAFARHKKGDLFISLHADSHPMTKKAKGISVYTLSKVASDKEAAKLAQKENKSDYLGGVDLKKHPLEVTNILLNLTQRETINYSNFLALTLLQCFREKVNKNLFLKIHRSADFAVLTAPDIPSVLIELGFLSNKSDCQTLLSKDYQDKVCSSILKAIKVYFGIDCAGFGREKGTFVKAGFSPPKTSCFFRASS